MLHAEQMDGINFCQLPLLSHQSTGTLAISSTPSAQTVYHIVTLTHCIHSLHHVFLAHLFTAADLRVSVPERQRRRARAEQGAHPRIVRAAMFCFYTLSCVASSLHFID